MTDTADGDVILELRDITKAYSGIVALKKADLKLRRGAVNVLVKPLVTALSCPLLVLSLGLFYLVINGAMLWLVDLMLDKFRIDGFLWGIAGGLFLAVFNLLLKPLVEKKEEN